MQPLTLLKPQFSKKKMIEFLNTFRLVKTRLVKCDLNSTPFSFYLSKKDDLYPFTLKNSFNTYENGTLLYWQQNCDGGIAIDIGAYTGIFSIVASVSGATEVFAFEPNKSSRELFHKNINSNTIKNIYVNTSALRESQGIDYLMFPKIRFHLSARITGSGVQLKSSSIKRDLKKWEAGQEIVVSTLDAQIPARLHSKIAIIKIDVEGAELSVLKGATGILRKSKSKLIIESLEPSTTESIVEYLETFSYQHINTLSKNLIFAKL